MSDSNTVNREVSRAEIIEVPLVGRIAAGTPILAEQNVEDSFPVPARFVKETIPALCLQ